MSLTDWQREWFACCVKRHLCKEEHYHEQAVAQMLADAWDAGYRSGVMWEYAQHTDQKFSPDANPHREATP